MAATRPITVATTERPSRPRRGPSVRAAAASTAVAALAAFGMPQASAAPLGHDTPLDWHGASSQVRVHDFRPGIGVGVSPFATDAQLEPAPQINADTSVEAFPDVVLPVPDVFPPLENQFVGALKARAAPYSLGGFVATEPMPAHFNSRDTILPDANGNLFPEVELATNAFFRDELFFSTVDGQAAKFEFDFNVSVTMEVVTGLPEDALFAPPPPGGLVPLANEEGGVSGARFEMVLLGPTENFLDPPDNLIREFKRLDSFGFEIREKDDPSEGLILEGVRKESDVETEEPMVLDFSTNPEFPLEGVVARITFDDTVTFSTDAILGADGLVRSGTFLPLSLTSFGEAADGLVDYFGSIELEDVRVLGEDGKPLDPSDYTLLGQNDAFEPFNNEAPSSEIPEPASLTLLGVGLAGLGFARRRRRA